MLSSKRVFFIMIGVIVLLSGAAVAVVMVGDSMLAKQAAHLTALKIEHKSLEQQQTALLQAKKDIAKYTELETITKAVVPQDKDQARAVREIVQIARASDITLKSITFSSSNLGLAATPAPTTSGSTTAPKTTTAPLSQAKPVPDIKGVYSMELTVIPDDKDRITYYQFLDFLSRLENNRRTAQVSQIKVDPITTNKSNPYVTFTLSLNIFVKP